MDYILEFFAKLHSLDELIRWGGYVVIALIVFAETGLLIGFFLPGDSLLVTAGLFAGTGVLNVWVLLALLSAMAILGDAAGYWFGRVTGPKIFTREKSVLFAKDHLLKARAFYEKYGTKTIVIARFIPFVRTFAPIVAGAAEMPYGRFAAYNVIGGILWVWSMTGVGYFLGSRIPDIEQKLHIVIGVIVLLSILPGVFEVLRHRRKSRR